MEVSQNVRLLGSILNRVGNFNMETFGERLIFQKTVYFLQAFGVYLGYTFTLYIHGPYSPQLTRVGFELKSKVKGMNELNFVDKKTEENFNKFLTFMTDFKNSSFDLEIFASLHLFKRLFPSDDKKAIIERLLKYKPSLTKEDCEKRWEILEKFNLV